MTWLAEGGPRLDGEPGCWTGSGRDKGQWTGDSLEDGAGERRRQVGFVWVPKGCLSDACCLVGVGVGVDIDASQAYGVHTMYNLDDVGSDCMHSRRRLLVPNS